MGKKTLRWARAFVGPYDLSGDARTFGTLANSLSEDIDQAGWDDDFHYYLDCDRRQFGVEGFQVILNDAANRSLAELKDLDNSEFAILFGDGVEPTVGDGCYMLPGVGISALHGFDAGLAVLNASFAADSGQYAVDMTNPFGRVLSANTSRTATYTGASVNNGASSAAGGWGLLLVTASDGGTWSLKIQDSANDVAWADLITFTATGNAVVAEIGQASGTVDQYTRALLTRTSGIMTAVVLFARN